MAEEFMDHTEPKSGTEGQTHCVHLKIYRTEIGHTLGDRKQQAALQHLKAGIEKEHRELTVQPATQHGKQDNPLQDVGSYPQVIPKCSERERKHGLPRKIYTLLRQPTTTAFF